MSNDRTLKCEHNKREREQEQNECYTRHELTVKKSKDRDNYILFDYFHLVLVVVSSSELFNRHSTNLFIEQQTNAHIASGKMDEAQ